MPWQESNWLRFSLPQELKPAEQEFVYDKVFGIGPLKNDAAYITQLLNYLGRVFVHLTGWLPTDASTKLTNEEVKNHLQTLVSIFTKNPHWSLAHSKYVETLREKTFKIITPEQFNAIQSIFNANWPNDINKPCKRTTIDEDLEDDTLLSCAVRNENKGLVEDFIKRGAKAGLHPPAIVKNHTPFSPLEEALTGNDESQKLVPVLLEDKTLTQKDLLQALKRCVDQTSPENCKLLLTKIGQTPKDDPDKSEILSNALRFEKWPNLRNCLEQWKNDEDFDEMISKTQDALNRHFEGFNPNKDKEINNLKGILSLILFDLGKTTELDKNYIGKILFRDNQKMENRYLIEIYLNKVKQTSQLDNVKNFINQTKGLDEDLGSLDKDQPQFDPKKKAFWDMCDECIKNAEKRSKFALLGNGLVFTPEGGSSFCSP